jgi:hypothetical protein
MSHRVIGALILIAGIALLWKAADVIAGHNQLRKKGITTNSLIIRSVVKEYPRSRKEYWLTIQFRDFNKVLRTVSFAAPYSYESFEYEQGNVLPITYDPTMPEVFEQTKFIYSRSNHKEFVLSLLVIFAGLLLLL